MKAILRSINNFSCKLKQSNNLKYNISPKIRSNKFKNISGSGNVVIEDALNKNLKDYKVYGNTVQKILPDGYTQVDYIESSGTQYIDTGFKPNQDTKIETKLNVVSRPTQYADLFGSREANTNQFHIIIRQNGLDGRYGIKSYVFNKSEIGLHNIIFDKNVLTIDNDHYTYGQQTFSSNFSAYIFGTNNTGSLQFPSNLKLYIFKIYDNNVLVRDFIPCYRNSDNEAGLYDLVNDVFYTNQGTGTFTYGSAAPTPDAPIEIVSCGDRTKNLIPTSSNDYEIGTINASDGQNQDNATRIRTKDYHPITVGNYHISIENSNYSYVNILYYDKNKNFLYAQGGIQNLTNRNISITNENVAYFRSMFRLTSSDDIVPSEISNIKPMITLGDTKLDFEPYGYKIPVNVRSENLFDIDTISNISGGTNNNDTITSATRSTSGTINLNFKFSDILVKAGETLYFSADIKLNNDSIGTFSIINDNVHARATKIIYPTLNNKYQRYQTSYTYSNDETVKSMLIQIGNLLGSFEVSNIMISKDDSIIYKSYYNETTNIYLDEPLRKIDGYSDYIDFINGKVVRNIGNKVLDGSETYYGGGAGTGSPDYTYVYTKVFDSLAISGVCPIFSSHFATIKGNMARGTVVSIDTMCIDKSASTDRTRFLILTSRLSASTTSAFKTWLSSHNVTVDYILATPIEEDIELPNINLIEGKNIITIGTEVYGVFEVEYYSKEIIDISNYKYNLRKVED